MTKPITKNTLFYGDNLPILREHIPDESVDLIYLDPPFNSSRSYNVLFKEESGSESESQITAFEDTWHWGQDTERTYHELIQNASVKVASMLGALRDFIGENQMMAYLVMMTARLIELHRVLKPTGSIYLHCDPTASHYLKIVMDTIFKFENFRNEIIWRRTNAHNKLSKQYGPIHDVILFYTKSDNFVFHPSRRPYMKAYIESNFPNSDQRGKFRPNELTGAGTRTGESGMPWRNYNPTPRGRHWAIPSKIVNELDVDTSKLSTQEIFDLLDKAGFIIHPTKGEGMPRYRQYLDTSEGVLLQDVWAYQPGTNNTLFGADEGIDEDVKWLDSDDERLGYPTQKPLGVLERIIETSTNEGDTVLDPFCGCGTAIAAAQKLNRNWIGIDVTHLSISLMKYRLKDSFGLVDKKDYAVVGEPEDLSSALQLAKDDRYQFQWWALSLVQAKPLGGDGGKEGKKGSDKGIDGVLNFVDGKNKLQRVLVQVKSGHVKSGDIRDLRGVVEREEAAIGIFLTLEEPSKDMNTEAVSAGFYHSDVWQKDYPRVQILTIEDLLNNKSIDMPPFATGQTFKQAEKIKKKEGKQGNLGI